MSSDVSPPGLRERWDFEDRVSFSFLSHFSFPEIRALLSARCAAVKDELLPPPASHAASHDQGDTWTRHPPKTPSNPNYCCKHCDSRRTDLQFLKNQVVKESAENRDGNSLPALQKHLLTNSPGVFPSCWP